ncbi:MAG: family transcriptional regulator, cyclic receptor protein [Chthoniobacter sp.]|nr:family transcriptional regulator, cyclic receptor protein [Chthoniobacter sp.]
MNPDLLRSLPFLKELTDEEVLAFANLLTTREVGPKEKILTVGEPVHEFFIVCEGTAHARRLAQKREMLLGRIEPGGFFGEINLFNEQAATASVYATGKVMLAVVRYDILRSFMSENPRIGYKIVSALMAGLAERLRQTDQRFVNTLYWAGGAR